MTYPQKSTPLSRILLIVAAVAGLASAGCVTRVYGHGYARTHVYYEEPVVFVEAPTLVYVGPGVYVVRDYDDAVYYTDGYYWSYRGGIWYRTAYWDEPWARVHVSVVPVHVAHSNHHAYVRYHGSASAQVYAAPSRAYHTASVSAKSASAPQPPPPPAQQGDSSVQVAGHVKARPAADAQAAASVHVNQSAGSSSDDSASRSSRRKGRSNSSSDDSSSQPDKQASAAAVQPAVVQQPAAAQPAAQPAARSDSKPSSSSSSSSPARSKKKGSSSRKSRH